MTKEERGKNVPDGARWEVADTDRAHYLASLEDGTPFPGVGARPRSNGPTKVACGPSAEWLDAMAKLEDEGGGFPAEFGALDGRCARISLMAIDIQRVILTARHRSLGDGDKKSWSEIAQGATAIRWLHNAPIFDGEVDGLSDDISDADAATECARLLETVCVTGKRGEIVTRILELTDAAVREIGGKLAVKHSVLKNGACV